MKIPKKLNRISIRVALIITLLVAALFLLLNFLVVSRGESVFNDVYGIIREQGTLPPSDTPFITPPPNQGFPLFRPIAGTKLTPHEHFRNRFQSSMILIGIIALLGAGGIGFLTSRIIARPLKKLGTGMGRLRKSHYQLRLEENDSEEFNALIKEFNELAAELQRVEELRKNLISDTSHELRTPLTSLMAQLEGMEDGIITADSTRFHRLREQVERLNEMVDRLQDYARLRSQTIGPQLISFHLKELLNKIVVDYGNKLQEKNIKVVLNIPDPFSLSADQKLLERVFTNLFDNALRYSQAKNITITASDEQIIFGDDGVGIPTEHLGDIFERFFRLEPSRSRETGGLGLGLSIVREIIEAHGWKITARRPENHQGVEFVISLK